MEPRNALPHSPSRDAWRVALYLVAATLLQIFARAFRLDAGTGVWYWTPALTLAFALTAPRHLLWATFIAPMPHQMLLGKWGPSYLPMTVICLSHGVFYGLGGWFLRRLGFDPALRRGRDLSIFLLFVVVAPMAFAIPSAWSLAHTRPTFGSWAQRIPRLWGEDAVGFLGLGPSLLMFGISEWASALRERSAAAHPLRIVEVLLQGMALVAIPLFVLLHPSGSQFPYAYLGFLPLLWVALRWGFQGTALAVLLFIGAMGGLYVALDLPMEGLLGLQTLLMVMGSTVLVVGHLVDIRKEHRRALLQQGLQLTTLLRGTGAVPFEMEAGSGRCTLLGRGALVASGYSMDEWQREPFWGAVIDPLHMPRFQAYLQELLNGGGSATVELALRSAGASRWIEVAASPMGVRDKVGGFFHDISTRKVMERRLEASEAHYRQLVDQSLIPTAVHQDGRFIYVNKAALGLLGYAQEDVLGKPVSILIHPDEIDDSVRRQMKVLQGENVDPVERRLVRKDGSVVLVDLLSIPCQHQGRPAAQVLAVDLTARKAVEEGLKERIREKELVIREIHHRVKNNLQVVSSLLRLQAGAHPESEAGQALEQAQSRIQAIASVHQRLHQAPSLAPEELREYLLRLVEQLIQTFSDVPARVHSQVDVEPLALGADQLVPLGLIVHELVLNALRHAFPPGGGGRLLLRLEADGPEIALVLSDDGKGLPEGDPFSGGGLGFQLVRALADQLKGRLEVDRSGGTTFRLRFPRPASPQP